MTKEELNRRVAVLLGQGPQKEAGCNLWTYKGGTSAHPIFWASEEKVWGECPDFATDPAAAELVRQEIKRRGWELTSRDMPPVLPMQPEWGFDVTIRGDDISLGSRSYYGNTSPYESLCLAFVAACEAAGKGGAGMREGTALWEDGEPTNLEAAASDALGWLGWLQKSGLTQAHHERLDNCVLRLREHLEASGVPTGDIGREEENEN